jgi:WD40 repeat protein
MIAVSLRLMIGLIAAFGMLIGMGIIGRGGDPGGILYMRGDGRNGYQVAHVNLDGIITTLPILPAGSHFEGGIDCTPTGDNWVIARIIDFLHIRFETASAPPATRTFDLPPGWIGSVSFAPEGERVALVATFPGYSPRAEIYLFDLTDGTLTPLTDNHLTESGVAWSPDGARLAFNYDDNTRGVEGIAVMDAAPNAPLHTLIESIMPKGAPIWSHDSTTLIYGAGTSFGAAFYRIAADGGAPTAIYSANAILAYPRFSPSGALLSFNRLDVRSGAQITVLDVKTGIARAVTGLESGYTNVNGCWLPSAVIAAAFGSMTGESGT